MSLICENCGMLTQPFKDGTCEFCGESVIKSIEQKFRENFGADYKDLILWIRSSKAIQEKIVIDVFTDEDTYKNR